MSRLKYKFFDALPDLTSLLADTALAANDLILAGLGKLQGQINALFIRRGYVNGVQTTGLRMEIMTGTSNAAGNLTITFNPAFSAAPSVFAQANQSLAAQGSIVQIVSISATQVVLKTKRTKDIALLDATVVEDAAIFVRILAIGAP